MKKGEMVLNYIVVLAVVVVVALVFMAIMADQIPSIFEEAVARNLE